MKKRGQIEKSEEDGLLKRSAFAQYPDSLQFE
jgi:hypothetical protein